MEIPEILQTIASHLDSKSLTSASLVSHHWHKHLSPLIWHTISAHDWTRPAFRPRVLYAQAHLVRDFSWHATTSSVYQQAVAARALQHMTGIGGSGFESMEVGAGAQIVTVSPPSMMTHFDVREGAHFPKPILQDQQQRLYGQGEVKEAETTADTKTTKGQVPIFTSSPQTTTPVTITPPPPPVPVLDHLSLICLNKIVGQCANLQKLSLHTLTSPSDRSDSASGGGGIHLDMIPVLQSLVHLQTLELYVNRVVVYQDQDETKGVLGAGGGGMGGELVRAVDREIVVQDLVRPLTQLRRLSLRGTAFVFNTLTTTTTNDKDQEQKNEKDDSFSIEHLTLDTPYISEQELVHLLTHTPALQSLDLPGGLSSWTWSDTFLETLRTYNTNLCEFSINASVQPPILEDQLVSLIRNGFRKPIRRFGARACLLEEGEIFTALLEQQANAFALLSEEKGVGLDCGQSWRGLEELDVSLAKRVGPLFRERLYGFLNTAEGLKRLEADGIWISLDDLVSIDNNNSDQQEQQQQGNGAEDVEGESSAGAGTEGTTETGGATDVQGPQPFLEIAQAQAQAQVTTTTTTIPHPQPQPIRPTCPGFASSKTLTHLHIGFSHPSRTTSHEHLQKMYSFLSTLTNLTHLQLSYTCFNVPSSSSSSSSSSSPGFQQLAALKRLRVFNIETCGYPALGREDVKRMVVENWPQLERLVLNQLGASQERVLRGWLREFGREDLVIESSRPSGMMFF